MFEAEQYQLLDFGGGRKLERFGGVIVDRPSPPAGRSVPRTPKRWRSADLLFREDTSVRSDGALGLRGTWIPQTELGQSILESGWKTTHSSPAFSLELNGSPFGHLGIFPEQSQNWDRLYQICTYSKNQLQRVPRVLNLFAYTGGSTLACAAAGAETTHLDAAKNIVSQGRKNAEISGLADAPIRWIADDAVKYVKREQKRKKFYDGIILDPPTYGHGARGEVWRLARDLPKLLNLLFGILDNQAPFLLLTCHSPGFGTAKLRSLIEERTERRGKISVSSMEITAETGAKLPAGEAVLWTGR